MYWFHLTTILLFKKNDKNENSLLKYIDNNVWWGWTIICSPDILSLTHYWCWQLRYITSVEVAEQEFMSGSWQWPATHPVTSRACADGNDGLTATHRKRVRTRQWLLLSQRLKYRHQHGHQLFSCGRHSPSRITLASCCLQTASQGFSTYSYSLLVLKRTTSASETSNSFVIW